MKNMQYTCTTICELSVLLSISGHIAASMNINFSVPSTEHSRYDNISIGNTVVLYYTIILLV